ncbi:3-hydroxyisobutyrate dehydrogenase [Streptomyces sp. AcH 505]|uniref:NAD(P)-dependent oxidoreductase n=1 Tax=Streptomyces sp. AcH 505 TaxID=352211 RepID=UPI0005922F04|nr:3-hydroxyisobutyrate dehydrogenase [Streptomyces sp. AcH 505]
MAEHSTVAVLGTGIMGTAIAHNLLRTGHTVRVWNRTAAKAEPLAAEGAELAATAAEAVTGADTVITTLYDGPAALEAATAAAPGLRPGAVWLQATTVDLDSVAELAELARQAGVLFVDSPVLGTKGPAEAGQLTVLAAGPDEARAKVGSVLEAIGQRTIWVGDDATTAAATRLKLVCNNWVLALTHGTAETLGLAKGLGVDPQSFFDAVAGGGIDCGYLHIKSDVILSDGYEPPSFALSTAAKDARLIVEAAEAADVRMDLTAAGAERFRRAEEQGHGDKDMAASYFASFD